MPEAAIDQLNITEVSATHLEILPAVRYKWLRTMEFTGYLAMSMVIHILTLVAGKSLLVAESMKHRLTGAKAA